MAKKGTKKLTVEMLLIKSMLILSMTLLSSSLPLARMRSTKDSLVISRKLKLLEAPDVYLVDEEYGVEEDIYEDNDGHEKEVKL